MDVIEVAADRCDACGARAYVYADYEDWPAALAYCSHHGTKYLTELKACGAVIIDHRDQIGNT